MEIKINYYKNNKELVRFLENNFDEKKDFSLIENKTIIVSLKIRGKIVGTLSLIDNKDLMNYLESKKSGMGDNFIFRAVKGIHIYNFTIDKKYRNKKLGYKLLKICLHIIKELGYSYCHCHVKENSVSQRMFLKLGFMIENVISSETRGKHKLNTLLSNQNMTYWIK